MLWSNVEFLKSSNVRESSDSATLSKSKPEMNAVSTASASDCAYRPWRPLNAAEQRLILSGNAAKMLGISLRADAPFDRRIIG
jgi:hypothetical protein